MNGFDPSGLNGKRGAKKLAEELFERLFGRSKKSKEEAEKLCKELASEEQMGQEQGTRLIAGIGAKDEFKEAARVASMHGGQASDWVKRSSSKYTTPDGRSFETHWVENTKTGERLEYKTKLSAKWWQGVTAFVASVLAPNALEAAELGAATEKDVLLHGAWDVATFLDPLGFADAIRDYIDRFTWHKRDERAPRQPCPPPPPTPRIRYYDPRNPYP